MLPLTHLAIALTPLGLYVLWISLRTWFRRPVVITGSQNTAEVAFGLLGIIIVGPLPLLIPTDSVIRFGGAIWILVLTMYVMVVILAVLMSRPQIIVSNIRIDTLRPLINGILHKMDDQCAWAGDSVVAPQLGVHFRMEVQPVLGNVLILANSEQQNFPAWNQLRKELNVAVKGISSNRHPTFLLWTLLGIALLAFPVYQFGKLHQKESLAKVFSDLLMVVK